MDITANLPAVAAVFCRIVENIQEHLLHPLGITADFRNVLVAGLIPEVNALLPQPAAVHKDGVLKYAPKIAGLHIELKPAILNAGADLYLPKPYEISDLIRWIEFFFK